MKHRLIRGHEIRFDPAVIAKKLDIDYLVPRAVDRNQVQGRSTAAALKTEQRKFIRHGDSLLMQRHALTEHFGGFKKTQRPVNSTVGHTEMRGDLTYQPALLAQIKHLHIAGRYAQSRLAEWHILYTAGQRALKA